MSEFIVVALGGGVLFCVLVLGLYEGLDWVIRKIWEGVGS